MVTIGLFHGLLFLPIVLSWVGPPPYQTSIIGSRSASVIDVKGVLKNSGIDANMSVKSIEKTAPKPASVIDVNGVLQNSGVDAKKSLNSIEKTAPKAAHLQ